MTRQLNKPVLAGLIVTIVFLLVIILLTSFVTIPPPGGKGDFVAYWSASYLLARGENFADGALLMYVEDVLANSPRDYVYRTWNPPWLLVILAPYTLVPFLQATWLWLLTNIALVFVAVVLLWKVYAGSSKPWLALILAFLFLPTLTTFAVGQVVTLVLIGLSAFLWAWQRERFFAAGMALSLTMIKPHLLYLTLPLIFLLVIRQRRWRVLSGFMAALLFLTLIAWALRPSFIQDYIVGVSEPTLLQWVNPTLGGFLGDVYGWGWGRFLGAVCLPIAVWLWWRYGQEINVYLLVSASVGLSLFTAPFGWSYDAILCLIPLAQILAWSVAKRVRWMDSVALLVTFLALEVGIYYGRTRAGGGEVFYFWVPLVVALMFFYAWWRLRPDFGPAIGAEVA